MTKFVLITGCSGGGKSTLLEELSARGYPTIAEPGRRIIAQERVAGGDALPWLNPATFARRGIDMSKADLARADALTGWVFFDRGLIDSAVAMETAVGTSLLETLGRTCQYHRKVFVAPPWRAIFAGDANRRHSFEDAVTEFQRIRSALTTLGYDICMLPNCATAKRADYVLETLDELR